MAIVTLTTDFCSVDVCAPVMKGVISSKAVETVLVDTTHETPACDGVAGSLTLRRIER
jgi:S-adenosylmethionine hydrolase